MTLNNHHLYSHSGKINERLHQLKLNETSFSIAEIKQPSLSGRIKIITQAAENLGFKFSKEITEYIARQENNNLTILLGAVRRIISLEKILNIPVSNDLVKQSLFKFNKL